MLLEYQFILWPILASIIGLVYGGYLIFWILKQPAGNNKMQEIAKAIQDGAVAYLKKQYQVVAIVAIILAIIIWFAFNVSTAIGFLIGGILSAGAGTIGMMVSTRGSVRCTEAARDSQKLAFAVAAKSGQVTGFIVASLALAAIAIFYLATKDIDA